MDAIVTSGIATAGAVAGYAGQRAIDFLVDKLAAAVVQPCAERRAHAYFRQLAQCMAGAESEEACPEKLATALDAVTRNSPASETVFEFYRRSVLSRTKEVGPRLMAMVAARVLAACRKPTDAEEEIAELAEICTDEDFSEFATYYKSLEEGTSHKNSERVSTVPGGYSVVVYTDGSDTSDSHSAVAAGPLNLSSDLGRWAGKMERVGVIEQHIETTGEWHGHIAHEMGDTEPGVRYHTEWSVFFGETCRELARLLPFASVPAPTP